MTYEDALSLKKGDRVGVHHDGEDLPAIVQNIAPVHWRREVTVFVVVPIRRLHLSVTTDRLQNLYRIPVRVHPELAAATETADLFD